MTDLALLALRNHARRLLSPWDRPDGAGATLGLARGGTLLLHESAGMASLELGVPIGPATRFRIASVSKQFTCAAILLLAEAGRLCPEDPVRRHLPELPDPGATVTLDHLMRNVSGLRDMLELMRLSGADLALPCAEDRLAEAIGRQRSLNFAPGTRFLYSNSGFMLLGRVVERVSGQPLGTFLEERILGPLGMTRTRHTPSTAEVVPGLATGYLPREGGGGFVRAQHGFPLGGEGGLVSCVEDLAIWDRALAEGRVIGRAVAEGLATAIPFANGRMNLYARGLEAGEYRGLRTLDHGGLWPGFRTCFLRVPALDMAVIAIANHGGVDAALLAHRMLDAAIEGMPGVHPVPPTPPRAALDRLAGRWIAEEDGFTTAEFAVAADGTVTATQHGVPFALAPTEDGRLAARRGSFVFLVTPPAEGEVRLLVETSAGMTAGFVRAPEAATLPPDLPGRYRCAELDADWIIAAAGDEGAELRIAGPVVAAAGPWAVEAIAPDALRVGMPGTLFRAWVDVRVLRDARGGIAGLSVSGARAQRLRFEREA